MKKLISILALFLFATTPTMAQKSGSEKTSSIATMELGDVAKAITEGLGLANATLQAKGLEISEAEVTLQTVRSAEGGGGFKIFVKGSKKWHLEKTSSIKFAYAKDSVMALSSEKGKESLHQALRAAITTAAEQWRKMGTEIPGLKQDSFTVEVSFGLTRTTSGGVEFEVWGVGVDLEASKEFTATHSVSLTFKSAKP
jgi:hypothetical protein